MKLSKSLPRNEIETILALKKELPRLLESMSIDNVTLGPAVKTGRPDMLVGVTAGKTKRTLVVEVKTIGEPRIAQNAIYRLSLLTREIDNSYPVFASTYLTESTRELCKSAGMGYIDLTGNVYLRFANVFFDRTSPKTPEYERRILRGLAAPKTSRVIRNLITHPDRAYAVTELARQTGVSPAEAYKVATMLDAKGYVARDARRKIIIVDPERLLQDWASSMKFDRNQIVDTYSLERTPEAIMKAISRAASESEGRRYALTMFSGAYLIAPYTRFYDVHTYIDGDIDWWMKKLDLKKVESGSNLHLVIPRDTGIFEEARKVEGFEVVSDIQLYADLLSNPARGSEQAEMIRKKINLKA